MPAFVSSSDRACPPCCDDRFGESYALAVQARSWFRGSLPLIACTAAAALIIAGCGSSSSPSASAPGSSASPRPATPATLEILSPAPNARTASTVDVELHLTRAHLVPGTQVGGILRPDRGHIHLSVDGQLVAMPLQLHDRLPPLAPGSHTLQAEFVASDHLPFANRVVAAVTFRVR